MLADSVEKLAGNVETLGEQLETLDERVGVLITAIDDLRAEVEWALRNFRRPAWEPSPPLTSVARDPLAEDFGARINQVDPADVPVNEEAEPPQARNELF